MKIKFYFQMLTAVIVLAMLSASAFAATQIKTAAELAAYCNGTITEDVELVAGAVYDMSPYAANWDDINTAGGVTFDGKGAVIKGVNYSNACLFGVNYGIIKNVNVQVTGSYTSKKNIGCICFNNLAAGSIINCTVEGTAAVSAVLPVLLEVQSAAALYQVFP